MVRVKVKWVYQDYYGFKQGGSYIGETTFKNGKGIVKVFNQDFQLSEKKYVELPIERKELIEIQFELGDSSMSKEEWDLHCLGYRNG
jgi:hypothetical protein